MSYINNALRGPMIAVVAILALAAVGLTACGGSSKATNAAATTTSSSSTSSGSSSSTSTTGASPIPGRGAPGSSPHSSALRECLKKNGITLPARTSGAGGYPGGGFLGSQLPKGVTRAQLQAAMQKCAPGGFARRAPGLRGPGAAKFREALGKFAACLRQNGVNVPAPDTSGRGPVFSTKGLQTNTPKFREAANKCRGTLMGAFRAGARTHSGSRG